MIASANIQFRKVAIIGIGLIGGSIAMGLRKYQLSREVVGVSRQQSVLTHAIKNKVIDRGTHDLKKAVENADLVILTTPVKTIIHMFPLIRRFLKRGCIVMDVGSTKEDIVGAASRHLPPFVSFVGVHPLTGSEKRGLHFSSAELFENSVCILTPTAKTNRGAVERIKTLWTKLGATVKFLSPEEHDKVLAYISHLPHLMAYALIKTIPQEYLPYASQGLKDTTRIASSDPHIWNDIVMTNTKNIVNSLDEFVQILGMFRKAITLNNEARLIEYFKDAKNKRDGFVSTS